MKSEALKKNRDALTCANLNLTNKNGKALPKRAHAVGLIAQAIYELHVAEIAEFEQARRGGLLCDLLYLRPDPDAPGRYLTTGGNKTPLGIFRTVRRVIVEGV